MYIFCECGSAMLWKHVCVVDPTSPTQQHWLNLYLEYEDSQLVTDDNTEVIMFAVLQRWWCKLTHFLVNQNKIVHTVCIYSIFYHCVLVTDFHSSVTLDTLWYCNIIHVPSGLCGEYKDCFHATFLSPKTPGDPCGVMSALVQYWRRSGGPRWPRLRREGEIEHHSASLYSFSYLFSSPTRSLSTLLTQLLRQILAQH